MGPLVYNVLTEFRFEIGHALLGSEKLAGAVDNISSAAENALFSFQKLGFGIVATMGLGSGGLLGVLGLALQVSDKFAQSQRDIANILTSNTGGTMSWADALMSADATMANINKKAQEFSLSTTDLLSTSKQIGAVLLSHGLDDTSLHKSVEISRQYLKSAPTLGVDPGEAQQQLVRAVMGNASGNDTLFNRLTGETAAARQFGGKGGTQKFNALTPEKRLDVLTKSLAQFSSNANYVKGNANSLTGEMKRLGEAIKGPFSIFRALGDVLMGPVLQALHAVNNYIQKEGKAIFQSIAKLLSKSLENPKQIIASLYQASQLKGDIHIASTIFGVIGGVKLLIHALELFGVSLPGLATVLGGVGYLWELFVPILGALAPILGAVVGFLADLIVPLGVLILLAQLISRAIAYARISDAQAIAELAPKFFEVMRILKFVFQPFFDAFDALAQFISPLFQVSIYAKAAVAALDFLVTGLLLARATFQGLVFALMEIFAQLENLLSGKGFNFSAVSDAFNAGIDQLLEEALGKLDSGESVVNQVTNIGKVEIKNQFKENMEPDRIAFSLTKQLAKVAQNPGQSRDRSFAPVGAG